MRVIPEPEDTGLKAIKERLLLRLRMQSQTSSSMQWASSDDAGFIRKGGHSDPIPGGQPQSDADLIERRYDSCTTNAARKRILFAALEQISMNEHRHERGNRTTREGRLIIGRDRRPAEVVAKDYDLSVRQIHRYRAAARAEDERLRAQARGEEKDAA